jgi:hypothetical protein
MQLPRLVPGRPRTQPSTSISCVISSSAAAIPGAHASCGGTWPRVRGTGKAALLYVRVSPDRATNRICATSDAFTNPARSRDHHELPTSSSSRISRLCVALLMRSICAGPEWPMPGLRPAAAPFHVDGADRKREPLQRPALGEGAHTDCNRSSRRAPRRPRGRHRDRLLPQPTLRLAGTERRCGTALVQRRTKAQHLNQRSLTLAALMIAALAAR